MIIKYAFPRNIKIEIKIVFLAFKALDYNFALYIFTNTKKKYINKSTNKAS